MASHQAQQIIATLHALLPSYPQQRRELPRPLVQLTQSLLQRSRGRAPNLRSGEEEAARTVAVAEIACRRLEGRLGLPRFVSRPPCNPKTYRRLYGYLEGLLSEGDDSGGGSPQSNKKKGIAEKNTPTKTAPTSLLQKVTPLKRVADNSSPASTPGRAKKRKATNDDPDMDADELIVVATDGEVNVDNTEDEGLVPIIRSLCKSLSIPLATPHVYAGVRTILDSAPETSTVTPAGSGIKQRAAAQREATKGRRANHVIESDKVSALIATVLCAVFDRMKTIDGQGLETREQQKNALRRKVSDQIVQMKILDPEQSESLDQDILYLENMAQERRWWSWEWLRNVPAAAVRALDDGEDSDASEHLDGPGESNEAQSQVITSAVSRSGCLMQDRFDWLTEDRRRDFERWRADILKRIEVKRREQESGSLDMLEEEQLEKQHDERPQVLRETRQTRGLAGNVLSSIRQSLFGRQAV